MNRGKGVTTAMMNRTRRRRQGIHLFPSVIKCEYGAKMFMRSLSLKHVYSKCENKIGPNGLEGIFHQQLEISCFQIRRFKTRCMLERPWLSRKELLLESRRKALCTLQKKAPDIMERYQERVLSKQAFGEHHTPNYIRCSRRSRKRRWNAGNSAPKAYDRILKVARTAATLAGSADIGIEDLEAIPYRSLDRQGWAGGGVYYKNYFPNA